MAICRDNQGAFLGSSALLIAGVWDAPTLEAMACREAVALAEDLNQHNYIVASDCKQVVEELVIGEQGFYGAVIRESRHRVSPTSKFTFEKREANVEAHKLAKHALSLVPGIICGLANHMIKLVSHSLWTSSNKRLLPLKKKMT